MALIYPNIVRALFKLHTGPLAPAASFSLAAAAGVSESAVYNSAGDYTVTLDQGLAANEGVLVGTSYGASPAANHAYYASSGYTSETTRSILYFDIDAANGTVTASNAPYYAWALFCLPNT